MLSLVLCNVFLSNLFFILNDFDIVNDLDIKTCGMFDAAVESLRVLAEKLFKWLKHNQEKGNTYRCHLILNTGYSSQVQVGNSMIKGGLYEKTFSC